MITTITIFYTIFFIKLNLTDIESNFENNLIKLNKRFADKMNLNSKKFNDNLSNN